MSRRLAIVLEEIEANDTNYDVRNRLVLQALYLAAEAGLTAGIRTDNAEPDWLVVYIDLPTGQVSWHVPEYPKSWDHHSTPEKYQRIHSYTSQFLGRRKRDIRANG